MIAKGGSRPDRGRPGQERHTTVVVCGECAVMIVGMGKFYSVNKFEIVVEI